MGQVITPATLQWSTDGQPFAADFGDCYFSAQDGLAETQHVFIAGNNLRDRWQHLDKDLFVIGETGFGTGLNFIAAWQLWKAIASPNAHLYFISAELHPLRKEDLVKSAQLWPELKHLYDQLIDQYPTLTPGFHTLRFENITLLLMFGDATEMFSGLLETDHPDFVAHIGSKVDAWFLDGFAPAKNPQLWNEALINTLAQLSKSETTLATFSAAGSMRRALEAAGFQVQKKPGFGSKRDMVTATFQHLPTQNNTLSMKDKPAFIASPYLAPWYINREHINKAKEVSIIGAGIAGCTLANALAKKGYRVTVIEEQDKPATQASGNEQAILYGKFSATDDEFAQFNLASYIYALRYYRQLLKQYPDLPIHLCGVVQLADFFPHYPDIAQVITQQQASELAGVAVESGGLFFPHAGWINPAGVCEQLLQHPNITPIFNRRVTDLHYENSQWHWSSGASAHVVIASGHQCKQFEQSQHLPLKLIRGQVTHATATALSAQLKTVICGEGYIAPANNGKQSFGATYTPKVSALTITDAEHKTNLENLALGSRVLSEEWNIDKGITGGRAHIRTASSDYFPVCGPLPKYEDFLNTYAPLRKNARANIPHAGSYYPNLYVFSGLGSRGMSYAPLCAEVLCSLISGAPLVLPRHITQQLNPARFIIRDLIKNRI